MSTESRTDRRSITRRIANLTVIAALIGGSVFAASTAAVAESAPGTPTQAPSADKRTAPRYPFVVDGVRYQPSQISLFDGRELFFTVDMARPTEMVGYTQKKDVDAALARMKAPATDGRAGTQQSGQYVELFSGDELTGDRFAVYSPYGVNYLAGIPRGCGWFGCAGVWDNVASSIYINGRASIYDGIEYTGSWLYFQGVGYANLSWYGFDNIVSSVNCWW
ncbi:MAG TPA: hypothetical protein VFC00_01275 [Micromonosporaceae bacterium]|nr:hypothetical protein [Micromonosporaceae bacterium]